MADFAASAGSALPALIGGIFAKAENRRARDHQREMFKKTKKLAAKVYAKERRNFVSDRQNDRQYAQALLDRDRAYSEKVLGQDRAYVEALSAKDRALFEASEARLQSQGERLSERTAASRGVNFAKLRDDAVAAGFNPLTAMSMAHAYSTEVPYENREQSWGGSTAASSPGRSIPSGVGAPSGAFQSSGAGYISSGEGPSLSSGGFIAEALSRGVETWFNSRQAERDQTEASVMAQVQQGYADRYRSARTPGNWDGWYSKTEPFSPAVTVGTPALDPTGFDQIVFGWGFPRTADDPAGKRIGAIRLPPGATETGRATDLFGENMDLTHGLPMTGRATATALEHPVVYRPRPRPGTLTQAQTGRLPVMPVWTNPDDSVSWY